MSERRETYAYFWIEGFWCDPSEITSLIQLEPYETRKKGDLVTSRFERTGQRHYWPKSGWEFRSRLPPNEIFHNSHIANILDSIESRAAELLDLQKTCEMGINCVGYYYGSNASFHLSADLIRRCAHLRLSIDFDLYNFSEENEEAEQADEATGVLPVPGP